SVLMGGLLRSGRASGLTTGFQWRTSFRPVTVISMAAA
ncbi:MAG: hypothetical protein RL260_933, partial [Pseudomonadota bacterium]